MKRPTLSLRKLDPTLLPPEEHLYRFHPETGEDAEELPADITVEGKEVVAEMRRGGAKFYWHKGPEDDSYGRVELSNIKFVLDMIGTKTVLHDTRVES